MPLKLFTAIILTFFLLPCFSQNGSGHSDPYEKAYQDRIKKTTLNGVYIPKDLTDCFIQLNRLTDDESKAKFKNMPEEDASRKLHFSLGRWMIYNWSFYEGSRLSVYLSKLGLSNPDDMAQFIIITYHRNLNRKKLDIKPLIDHYQAKKEKRIEERRQKGTIIHEETRKREKKEEGN